MNGERLRTARPADAGLRSLYGDWSPAPGAKFPPRGDRRRAHLVSVRTSAIRFFADAALRVFDLRERFAMLLSTSEMSAICARW